MHLFLSPVVVTQYGKRLRPHLIPVCSLEELEALRPVVLNSAPSRDQKRFEDLFGLLRQLPQIKGQLSLVGLDERNMNLRLEVCDEFLSDSANWNIGVHAQLNDYLGEFATIKRWDAESPLNIFMHSTTIRLLDHYVSLMNQTARVVPHTWENRMVEGEGFVLLDLDNGTYIGGATDGSLSLSSGYTLFTATVFPEEETAEKFAQEIANYFPNLALAPVHTRLDVLRVVQMDARHHPRVDENLARFSKALITKEMSAKEEATPSSLKLPRKI